MSSMLDAIARMLALSSAGFARTPTTQPEVQRQLHRFDQQVGSAEPVEELRPFLDRSRRKGAAALRRYELNRVLRGAWCDGMFDDFGAEAVERAELEGKRSSDQAVIEGYLSYFPHDRPVIARLADVAQRAADRHVWAWQRRSRDWTLFDPERGPARVGKAVATAADGASLLAGIGIGRQLAATRFGRFAFVAACDEIAGMRGAEASRAQAGLLSLFDADTQASDLPHLVRALLEPWLCDKPEQQHRKTVSAFLLDQVGDPRVSPQRWQSVSSAMARMVGAERAGAIVHVLKRWLTDVAMRTFFKAIAKTTDRPDQWKQRENFWLSYLDAGLVSDAWPALGSRAQRQIEDLIRRSGERPEYGVVQGGPAASSTIIMQIGDLRISEWSDNGSCRFWSANDRKAPDLYKKTYAGGDLRTTSGRHDFEYHSHIPSLGWEGKFAGIIHRRTNVSHPQFGQGRAQTWGGSW